MPDAYFTGEVIACPSVIQDAYAAFYVTVALFDPTYDDPKLKEPSILHTKDYSAVSNALTVREYYEQKCGLLRQAID